MEVWGFLKEQRTPERVNMDKCKDQLFLNFLEG